MKRLRRVAWLVMVIADAVARLGHDGGSGAGTFARARFRTYPDRRVQELHQEFSGQNSQARLR